ncbi:HNH endonuclease [Macrococcoides caseolyticum]|uniref:HNH endonuclease n=1 Tax=Macrococcoides caseolyticum TaxID=69966 RepID=UPI003F622652
MDPIVRNHLLNNFVNLMGIEITEFKNTFSNIKISEYPEQSFHMISAGGRGIYKPKDSPYALSIRCEINENSYKNQIIFDENGKLVKILYHGPVSTKLEKRALTDVKSLVACYNDKIPFGIIHVIEKKKKYISLGLGVVKSYKNNLFEIIPYYLDNSKESNYEFFSSNDLFLNKITESEYNLKIRTAQSEFRRNLLNKYNSCFICNLSFEPLLIASHIKPWSLCSDRERLDVNNGLLLCTHHDKLFDKGYITFINNKISVSKALPEHSLLKISNIQRNYDFNKKQEIYMKFHNSNIFLDRLDE